jgi:hypothetical protein
MRLLTSPVHAVVLGVLAALLLLCSRARAQVSYVTGEDTVFAHSQALPFWISAQGNYIFQWHPRFHSQYSGPNSFERASEQAVSAVETVYTGLRIDQNTEAGLDFESAGGRGLGGVRGLAGEPNLDAVRNLDANPYIARLWYREVIPLSDERVDVERGPLSQLTTLPVRRLDIHLGKFDLVDFFDLNGVANDSHTQFLNWTVVNDGAFDYAADVRGYTYGAIMTMRIAGGASDSVRRCYPSVPTDSIFRRICRTHTLRTMNWSFVRRSGRDEAPRSVCWASRISPIWATTIRP